MNESILHTNNNYQFSKTNRMKLYVKYMVCFRDKLYVKSVLNKHGLNYRITVHGAIEILEEITKIQFYELKLGLSKSGLKLLDAKESMLIDRIINTIIEVIHYSDTLPKVNFEELISDFAGSGKESILKIFTDVKGMSVLQFIITQKIERAKELLVYEDMPVQDIAELLNYKNQDYLIVQFEKTTGLTPFYFKRLKNERMRITEKYINSTHLNVAGVSS